MNIKQQLVSQSIINSRSYGTGNKCNYITIHETDNTKEGANAQAHANLQSNKNPREASWHYQVDDKQVIQSFPDNVQCWAAGDGRGSGNTESIHIEMCVNSDGDYKKTVANTVELVRHLMKTHNISAGRVVQHNRWSGKNCPRFMRSATKGISWNQFMEMVKGQAKPKEEPKYYYVQVGAYSNKKNAEDMANKLHKAGFPSYIKYE